MPNHKPPDGHAIEAMNSTARAREASAYAAGAAKASWEALIRAADQAREAADAWQLLQEARDAGSNEDLRLEAPRDESSDPVALAEATILSALPGEAKHRLIRQARVAALRSQEAHEIAEFTGNLAMQAAAEWSKAKQAWNAICESLADEDDKLGDERAKDTITVIANGDPYSIPPQTTIAEFIASLGLPVDSCIAELNGDALTNKELTSTLLSDGDRLEIVRAVAGGSQ